jgi:hypothetical protein
MNIFDDKRRDESDAVSAMLNELPTVEPPPGLVRGVMSAIQRNPAQAAVSIPYTRRGSTMAKKVLWTMVAAAAVALITLRIAGYPPVENGTEATIGAAERYQSQQISNADVKTNDAQLQAFMQSDLFHKLATDKAAREALKNKDFQRAMADASVRAALARPDVRLAIANLYQAAPGARLDAAQVAAARLDAAGRAALEAALEASPALASALAAPGVALALSNASLGAALARPDAAFAMSQDAVVNAMMAAPGAALEAAGGAAPGAAPGVAIE